jgi:hypothetical protein
MFIADVTNFPDHHQISRTQNHPFIQQSLPKSPSPSKTPSILSKFLSDFTMKPRVTAFVAGGLLWHIPLKPFKMPFSQTFLVIAHPSSSIVLHYPSLRADPQIPMEEVLQ